MNECDVAFLTEVFVPNRIQAHVFGSDGAPASLCAASDKRCVFTWQADRPITADDAVG